MKKKYKFRITQRDINIVRRIHISLLAKPKDRYLRPWPDPKLEQTLPAQVSQAAMKSKPSERTIMLFKSKKMYVEGKKYEPPKKPDHYVEPPALNAVASARIVKLAQPKILKKVKKQLSRKQLARRKRKFQKYKREREAWLKSRAMPKKVPPPQPIPVERKWSFPVRKSPPLTPLQRFERLLILAQPSAHRMKQDEPPRRTGPPFKEVTDRVRELAIPRRIPSETLKNMKYRPGIIKRNVLKAKTSERTKTLAKPRPRSKAVDNDVREDAFTIPPNALTYKASRRIVELAKPRKR